MSHGRGNTNTFLGQGATAFNFRLGSRSLIKTVGCLVTDSEMQGIQIGEGKKIKKKKYHGGVLVVVFVLRCMALPSFPGNMPLTSHHECHLPHRDPAVNPVLLLNPGLTSIHHTEYVPTF